MVCLFKSSIIIMLIIKSIVIIFIELARVVCFTLQKCDVISSKGA